MKNCGLLSPRQTKKTRQKKDKESEKEKKDKKKKKEREQRGRSASKETKEDLDSEIERSLFGNGAAERGKPAASTAPGNASVEEADDDDAKAATEQPAEAAPPVKPGQSSIAEFSMDLAILHMCCVVVCA